MKILVVDGSELFRKGLVQLLTKEYGANAVEEAKDGWEAVVRARTTRPDLVLIDPQMQDVNGLQAMKQIKVEHPSARFIVLTETHNGADFYQAFRCGAQGYILKNSVPDELVRGIRDVMNGEMAISSSCAGKLVQEFVSRNGWKRDDGEKELTEREREVLELLGTGASNKKIGNVLNLSASTVQHHIQNILHKLHMKNRVEAALFIKGRSLSSENQRTGEVGNPLTSPAANF